MWGRAQSARRACTKLEGGGALEGLLLQQARCDLQRSHARGFSWMLRARALSLPLRLPLPGSPLLPIFLPSPLCSLPLPLLPHSSLLPHRSPAHSGRALARLFAHPSLLALQPGLARLASSPLESRALPSPSPALPRLPPPATPRAPKCSLPLLPFSRHLPYANPDSQVSHLTGVASTLLLECDDGCGYCIKDGWECGERGGRACLSALPRPTLACLRSPPSLLALSPLDGPPFCDFCANNLQRTSSPIWVSVELLASSTSLRVATADFASRRATDKPTQRASRLALDNAANVDVGRMWLKRNAPAVCIRCMFPLPPLLPSCAPITVFPRCFLPFCAGVCHNFEWTCTPSSDAKY
ncbi:hypothetical protein K438DRAFT_534634 [Mycena galopus ATCC 62051]|nr:hypothetical protein K438DRAFT_534634 [Mycena galopus ATCC 62051]